MSTIVLASGNAKKIAELQHILQSSGHNIVPQKQFKIMDAVEDGVTFVENALKKARHAARASGLPAIADDSGIEVDALNGAPGIYSARYAGENATDADNNRKLLQALKNVPEEKRTARYQCVIVYLRHALDPTPVICQGSWEGVLLASPQGEGGFGYDPLFFCPEFNKTAAELSPEEKKSVSHRGKALEQLNQFFAALK